MAYEYGSSAKGLDFPNPFRVENVFRFIAAAVLIGGGLIAIFQGRSGLYAHIGDRKSTRLNSSHLTASRMPSSA